MLCEIVVGGVQKKPQTNNDGKPISGNRGNCFSCELGRMLGALQNINQNYIKSRRSNNLG